MARLRFAVAFVLALLALGIGVVASLPVTVPVRVAGRTEPDAALDYSSNRTAVVTVHLRSTVRGVEMTADYVINVPQNDPLVVAVQYGTVNGRSLAGRVAGAPTSGVYTDPVVEYDQGALWARLVFSSGPDVVSYGAYVERPDSLEAPGLVASRTLDIRGEGVDLWVTGDKARSISRNHALFVGSVHDFVFVRVTAGSGLTTDWSLTSGPVLWHLGAGLPWLLVLLMVGRSRHRARGPMRAAAIGYVAMIPLLAAILLWAPPSSGLVLAVIFLVAPTLVLAWCRAMRGLSPTGGWVRWLAVGLATGTVVGSFLVTDGPPWRLLVGGVAAGLSLASAAWAAGYRSWTVVLGLLGLTLVPGAAVVTFVYQQTTVPYGGVAEVVLGLCVAPVVFGVLSVSQVPRRRFAYPLALLASMVLFVPVVALAMDAAGAVEASYPYVRPITEGEQGVLVVTGTLVVLLVVVAYRLAADPAVYAEPLVRLAMVVVVLVASTPHSVSTFGQLIALALLVATLLWLAPTSRMPRAVRLARISPRTHARLVRAELWQRLVDRVAREVHRTGVTRAAAGDVGLAELHRTWTASVGVAPRRQGVYLTEAALGSGAGFTPRQNLLAGVAAAAVLAMPMMWYEVSLVLFGPGTDVTTQSTLSLIDQLRPVLRWVAYGAVFGLLYPLIRGERPVTKAGFLLVALLVPELLAIALTPYSTTQAIWFALVIRSGQITVLAIGLGLFWEWRLSRAAGLGWAQLRDFRRAGALITPVTTVVVAAATAIATALAGAAVAAILQSPSTGPTTPSSSPAQQR